MPHGGGHGAAQGANLKATNELGRMATVLAISGEGLWQALETSATIGRIGATGRRRLALTKRRYR